MNSYSPRLVSLYGENQERTILNYLDPEDLELLGDDLSGKDLNVRELHYLKEKYPELMGFWVTLIKRIGKGVKKIGGAIAKGVRGKKARRRAAAKRKKKKKKKAAEARRAQALYVMQVAEMQKRKRNRMIALVVPIGLLGFLLLVPPIKKTERKAVS